MKNRLAQILIVAIVGVFMVVATTATAADTIKLGVAGPHSGDLASYGIPTIKAAELVVKDINAKGGVLGKQVELLVEDDVCKPEVATNTATKLVSEGVHVCWATSAPEPPRRLWVFTKTPAFRSCRRRPPTPR